MTINELIQRTDKVKPFQAGDKVAFGGDSITHNGLYLPILEYFYATRFPNRKIRFHNKGISGDSAVGGLQRLSWDILQDNPNIVTLMFGMNDINRGLYGKQDATDAVKKGRQQAIINHQDSMERIVQKLSEFGKQIIIFTPTPYDQTAEIDCENLFGCNDALAELGEYGYSLAQKFDCAFVHLNAPLVEINQKCQQNNPAATIIGPDRVHPGPVGHMLITALILCQTELEDLGSLTIENGSVAQSKNIAIGNFTHSTDSISMEFCPNGLPFFIAEQYRPAETFLPITELLNQQPIQVANLPQGTYTLSCGDYQNQYSSEELANGINLAILPTPWQKQAEDTHNLAMKKKEVDGIIRNVTKVEFMFRQNGVSMDDHNAADAMWNRQKEYNEAYFSNLEKSWLANKDKLEELKEQSDSLHDEMYRIAQPKTCKLSITCNK